MTLLLKLRDLFLHPARAFRSIVEDGEPPKEFGWMVACFALTSLMVSYIGSKRFFDPYYFGASSFAFVLAWFGYASILYWFCRALGGDGKFIHLLEGMALMMTSVPILMVVETPFVSVHPGHLDVGLVATAPPVIAFGVWLLFLITFLASEAMHLSRRRAFAAYLLSTITFYAMAGAYFGLVAYFH